MSSIRTWIQSWKRYRALAADERSLWLAAWWELLGASVRLRLEPRRTLLRALTPARAARGTRARAPHVARAVASAAAHHLRPMSCLPRAVALRRLLGRRGYAARVQVGVRREGGALLAHAWVEVDGAPLGEPEAIEARFLPLLPAAAAAIDPEAPRDAV